MLQEYLPILIFLGVAAGMGVLLMALGFLFGSGTKDDEKLSPYECGFEPFEDSRTAPLGLSDGSFDRLRG